MAPDKLPQRERKYITLTHNQEDAKRAQDIVRGLGFLVERKDPDKFDVYFDPSKITELEALISEENERKQFKNPAPTITSGWISSREVKVEVEPTKKYEEPIIQSNVSRDVLKYLIPK